MADASDIGVLSAALGRLKIFPLPTAVLLPGSVLPLHIFEPRYRAMIADALASDRVLALAMIEPGYEASYAGRPPLRPICGAGIVEREERLPDGRFNILLRGVARVSIRFEHPPDRLYREVVAELVTGLPPRRHDALELLRRFLFAVAPQVPEAESTALLRLAARASDAGDLADAAAAILVADPQGRQAILEAVEADRRIDHLMAAASTTLRQADGLKH